MSYPPVGRRRRVQETHPSTLRLRAPEAAQGKMHAFGMLFLRFTLKRGLIVVQSRPPPPRSVRTRLAGLGCMAVADAIRCGPAGTAVGAAFSRIQRYFTMQLVGTDKDARFDECFDKGDDVQDGFMVRITRVDAGVGH